MTFNSATESNAKEYHKGGLIFKSEDNYISICKVEDWLYFLYKPNPEYNEHCKYCFKPFNFI